MLSLFYILLLTNLSAVADEYVAHIAEKMDLNELEKSVWQRLIDYGSVEIYCG